MPHFKDSSGKVHFLTPEDIAAGFSRFLPQDVQEISEDEAKRAIIKPIGKNDAILAQIVELEATVTPRRLREAAVGIDGGWLKDVDDQIADLRKKMVKK